MMMMMMIIIIIIIIIIAAKGPTFTQEFLKIISSK
jgi:hypothetical protein